MQGKKPILTRMGRVKINSTIVDSLGEKNKQGNKGRGYYLLETLGAMPQTYHKSNFDLRSVNKFAFGLRAFKLLNF